MQYVRSISGSVSKTWNSINPATLSGAIDVIVVEQEDGSLACSPFHVRFGKFSLLRPSEKKVEFRVNDEKQDYAMKLGDGGEAFFVFETSDDIPESLQTSPLVSPASSPPLPAAGLNAPGFQEPDFLDLETESGRKENRPGPSVLSSSVPQNPSNLSVYTPLSGSPDHNTTRPVSGDWSGLPLNRENTDELMKGVRAHSDDDASLRHRLARSVSPTFVTHDGQSDSPTERSQSPPPLHMKEAIERAISLSKQLAVSNITSLVTEMGDLMLDMTGYKSSDDDALRAEVVARKILSEELEGNYDTGALIGADEQGNLWIYSSEEAKEAATRRANLAGVNASHLLTSDAASDPGYHSDEGDSDTLRREVIPGRKRAESDQYFGLETPPNTPPDSGTAGDPNRNYAKTLRLTSDQLKALDLKPGPNIMSFTVNRATCTAYMYLWKHDVPIVISDIDGTITKSDALGHVLNMIGRDWTHIGVAKLYTEIVANGYNIMYLTSRSVGQADTTRTYLSGVVQDGYRLPRGPTIMSPDRTIAALRREIYLRKPEVFKMACLRDIKSLFGSGKTPFYAGFGNRLTDALSYRSVSIPSNRIFTINSYAEVSLDLLTLNKLKLSYVNMREVVDHYFPSIGMLIKGGGEEFTDFSYWRDTPLEIEDFSDSEGSEGTASDNGEDEEDEDEDEDEEEDIGDMGDSYISRASMDESILSEDIDEDEDEDEDGEDNGEGYESEDLTTSRIEFQVRTTETMLMPVTPGVQAGEDKEDEDEEEEEAEWAEFPPDVEAQAPKLEAASKQRSRHDTNAEIISGMENISLEKA